MGWLRQSQLNQQRVTWGSLAEICVEMLRFERFNWFYHNNDTPADRGLCVCVGLSLV